MLDLDITLVAEIMLHLINCMVVYTIHMTPVLLIAHVGKHLADQ